MIYVPVDPHAGVPGYESWWDVPVAEVSEQPVESARRGVAGGQGEAAPLIYRATRKATHCSAD